MWPLWFEDEPDSLLWRLWVLDIPSLAELGISDRGGERPKRSCSRGRGAEAAAAPISISAPSSKPRSRSASRRRRDSEEGTRKGTAIGTSISSSCIHTSVSTSNKNNEPPNKFPVSLAEQVSQKWVREFLPKYELLLVLSIPKDPDRVSSVSQGH